jgi:betaine-aldehyde dehydrogenase
LLRSGLAIGGEFVAPAQGKYIDVVNPATKRIFHQVPAATAEDVNKAVASAKRAFPIWRDTPVEERARLLRAVAAKLRERVDELAEYEVLDNGKPKKEAEMDIQDTAACFEYYAGEIIRVEKEEQNKSVRLDT